jgi:uncharacterized protein (DUF58 family)
MTRLVPEWGIRITNFGLGYILLCLLVAIAATNTGNNGLYSVLAGMLAAMACSGFVSRRNVGAVEAEIEAVGEVFAGQASVLAVRLRNRSRHLSVQALFFLHEALPGSLWIDRLAPSEVREAFLEAVFPLRGVYTECDSGVVSRFPLGLFRKYNRARLLREVVVYPNPVRVSRPEPPPRDAAGGRPESRRRGGGSEIRTLRDFSPGDDPRDLHWKQSARMRRWIIREREAERDRAVVLEIENAVSDPSDPAELAALERVISLAAGEALEILARGGEVGIIARGLAVPPRSGAGQRRAILDCLARLAALSAAGAPPMPSVQRGQERRTVAAS